MKRILSLFLALTMLLTVAVASIYGPVSIVSCADRTGRMHRVMLKEDESTWNQ